MHGKTLIPILFAASCTLLCVAQQSPSQAESSDAEQVAQKYMTAFFHSDLRVAAMLTDPNTLQQIKTAFIGEWEKAKTKGTEAEFLKKSGVEDNRDLRSLEPSDFYVAVLEGARRSTPEETAAMKLTQVVTKGSEPLDSQRIKVTLVITTPTPKGPSQQDANLLVVKVDGKWKVVGNAR